MPTVREYESALQKNPADTEAFVALRKAYRQAQKHDRLVTLYETRAQAIDDAPKAGELFYLAAELRLDQLGDPEGAEADLVNAVDRDPTHIRAAARLKDIYREQGRTADYMTMLEMEAAAVARTRDATRIAELEAEMSQLFLNHFAKLERLVRSPQRPGKLAPDHVRSIESARKIYRALGDFRSVVRLYELELEGTSEARRRADLLFGLGRILGEKLEELDAAAQRLAEVVRLRPRDEKALELLASIYANPNWIGADGIERAAAIYHQVARRRQEAGDAENAIASLRKALQAVPHHAESVELLERVYYEGERYQELDRFYRERVAAAADEADRINFLYKRAQLAEGELDDRAEAQRVYNEISLLEPPGGPASEKLVELYVSGQEYAKLAELRERQLGAVSEPPARAALMLELATLYRDRLGDRDQAAVYLHAVLEIEPENQAALAAYGEHFREKGDWAALADLLEFSYERVRLGGASVDDLLPRLEEIATICEKQLGDTERALAAWERAEEIDPGYSRAREAQRRLLLKVKSWDRMAALLEREAAAQSDPGARAEILRRVAQIHREKLANPGRAIEIYKEILRDDPRDTVSMRLVVEVYEREGDYVSLAQLLRDQIQGTESKQERVGLLRRVLVICDEHTNDLTQGQWAANEILQAVPGDRDTLTRLERILERANLPAELARVLEQHTKHAANPDEKIQLLHRIAELQLGTLQNPAAAAERLEEVIRLDPDDGKALDTLGEIYAALGDYPHLAKVLDAQVERVVADAALQAEYLRQLARLVEGSLNDLPRARQAWEQLAELLPTDEEALDALARIAHDLQDWTGLVKIFERQIPLTKDPARAVTLALARAQLFEEKLLDTDAATEALERLIAEVDPRSQEAHARLRAIYERDEDWPRVVKIAERQLFLTEDPAKRVAAALALGDLARLRLGDDRKAISIYERVLEIDPGNTPALTAAAALYLKTGNYQRLAFADEKLLEQVAEPVERRRIYLEIAALYEDHLDDPLRAFEWYRRAYLDRPDAEGLLMLDRAAERHGLYEELIQIYDGARARAAEPIEQLAASLKIALICEDKLHDEKRAFQTLCDALPSDPAGRELLPNIERLAGRAKDWRALLEVYARVARARTEVTERVELLRLRAEVRERKMDDPSGALDEMLRSFAIHPENLATQEEILRLARKTGRWEEAVRVQGQLFALADDLPEKLGIARNAAHLVEHEVKDLVRAFRAYLNAFRLAPDDREIVGHLWRLAALIGRYEHDTPTPVTRPAPDEELTVEVDTETEIDEPDVETVAEADDDAGGETVAEANDQPAGEAADEEITVAAEPAVTDEDPTHEVSAEDLAALVGSVEGAVDDTVAMVAPPDESGATAITDEDVADEQTDPGTRAARAAEAVPAVPEGARAVDPTNETVIEEIEEIADGDVLLDDTSGAIAVTPPSSPLRPPTPPPVSANRVEDDVPYATPWEELAAAYDTLPADDIDTHRRYLRKIVEVWERGQRDIDRALDALERAFHLDTENAEIRAELERVGGEYDRWDRVCEIYLGAIDEFGPIDDAVALHHEVARLREMLGQTDKLEAIYREILRLDSDDPVALKRTEQIFREQERWEDLATVLEKRTSTSSEALPPPERRARLRELASLYEERLERPYEAVDTLERLLLESDESRSTGEVFPIEPGAVLEAQEALGRLYSRVGLWAKAVESLQKQAELTPDRQRARALRLEVATVYEKELSQPDRAGEAYEAILAEIPDDQEALAALDRLNEAHGRADEQQEILRRRAALATGDERVDLVRRRARILEERLNNPEAAASALRDLGPEAIADDELMAALLRNLRRAGLAHEAARVLSLRIELEKGRGKKKADLRRITELTLELSLLKLDDLNDPVGARKEVEAALQVSPENPAALAALARLHLKENDFAGYSETRVREARALRGQPAAIEALLDAGRVYREQVGAPDKARACYEEALGDAPTHPEALRALAALLAAESQWDEARRVLERLLGTEEEPTARAATLSELARIAWDGMSDAALAQSRLDEALTLVPDHLPAILEIADIYYKEGQWEQAEKRLSEAVRRLRNLPRGARSAETGPGSGDPGTSELDAGAQQSVKLFQRLAEVHEKLGKLDEAYRQLVEADKMGPGQLLTKLSLGENRFRAGRWREAVLHLGSLAQHPDAALYPDEVADALTHAAQAEIKLRHPERAIELYEAALSLRAGHRGALRALADLALERGERRKAASYLRRIAEESADRDERAQTFERLGDELVELDDRAQALVAYADALRASGSEPTPEQVPLLEKMLKLQRDVGDKDAAAQTSAKLIELVSDPKERSERRREAALLMAERGDVRDAASLLERALADDPRDEAALVALCDLTDRLPPTAGVALAERLAGVLETLPPPPEQREARARRARLWARHGELLRAGDPEGAIAAFERVVALDDTQTAAREALASLYPGRPGHEEAELENHRRLLATDITRADSVRALAAHYTARGQLDRARCCHELLVLLGQATPEEAAFLSAYPLPELKPDDPYASPTDEHDRRERLALPEATQMSEIFSCLWEGAPGLIGQRLEDFGVSSRDKVSPMSELDLGKIYGQVAKALGNKKTALYVKPETPSNGSHGVTIVVQAPPALVVGPGLAADAPPAEIRFQLARGIELTRPEYILAAGVRPKQFTSLFGSVLKAFHPRHSRRRAAAGDAAAEQAARLKKNVPYKVSKQLVNLFQGLGATSWSSLRWRTVVHHVGNRTGLLLCGELAIAANILIRESGAVGEGAQPTPEEIRQLAKTHEPLRELLRFSISEDYFLLREKIGTATNGAAAAS
jgi:tetratricopeptide (TPR) repeat protein